MAIPIRLAPLPGEALDSWLETYAHLLHVTLRDIFVLAGVGWTMSPARPSPGISCGFTIWTRPPWAGSAP